MSDLRKRLELTLIGGFVTPTIALGKQLGLFDALAEASGIRMHSCRCQGHRRQGTIDPCAPVTWVINGRYVLEWLAVLACAGFIEVTPDEKFWMSNEATHEFSGTNNLVVSQMSFQPAAVQTFNELADAFRKEGRFGIGMNEKLEAGGIKVLDVGCGSGYHELKMASTYPKCEVHGADISEQAIGMANDSLKVQGQTNLTFHVADAGNMPSDWTEFFDFITIFDACHDQMRPDLCLIEIHRMLKPGGVFALLEVRGSSNIHADKAKRGSFISALYAISMFHCLPVGSNRPDALCMGAMWGEKRAKKLIEDAGFVMDDVQVFEPAFFPMNIAYICKK